MRMEYLKNVSSIEIPNIDDCTGCGMCINVCPHNVFELVGKKSRIINKNACMECGACKMNCPAGVIQVNSGVGCAAAIIEGILKNKTPECGCSGEKEKTACCN